MISSGQSAKLKEIALKHEVLGLGAIRLTGLNAVCAADPANWAATQARISTAIEIAVEETVGPSDLAISIGHSGQVCVFADGDVGYAITEVERLEAAIKSEIFRIDPLLAGYVDTTANAFACDRSEISEELGKVMAAMPEGERRPMWAEATDAAALKTYFSPTWNVEKGAVIEFGARPYDTTGDDVVPFKLGAASGAAQRRRGVETDLATIDACQMAFERLRSRGARAILNASLSAASMRDDVSASRIVGAIKTLDVEYRKLLSCTVHDGQLGASSKDALLAVRSLTPLCREVVLCTVINEKRFSTAQSIGVAELRVDVGAFNHIPEAPVMDMLETFARSARRNGLRVGLDGVATRSMSSFAVCAGITHLSGPAIGDAVSTITKAVKFEPKNLYHIAAR